MTYLFAFVTTQCIEVAIAFVLVRHRTIFVPVFVVNCITHPIAWWWYQRHTLYFGSGNNTVLVLEVLIAFIEAAALGAILYRRSQSHWRQAAIAGLIMNPVSFVVGTIIWYTVIN